MHPCSPLPPPQETSIGSLDLNGSLGSTNRPSPLAMAQPSTVDAFPEGPPTLVIEAAWGGHPDLTLYLLTPWGETLRGIPAAGAPGGRYKAHVQLRDPMRHGAYKVQLGGQPGGAEVPYTVGVEGRQGRHVFEGKLRSEPKAADVCTIQFTADPEQV